MAILCFVARFDEHELFWPHFCEFYAANKAKHSLLLEHKYRMALHKAQGWAVEKARQSGLSHILFVEDDHWGFPVDGIDAMLEADKDVIGIHCFARNRPLISIALRKMNPDISLIATEGEDNLNGIEHVSGTPLIQPVDLIGWGMTLVKMTVFDRLKTDPFEYWGRMATDSQFCQACLDVGIQPYVHFGATLGHGDCPPDMRIAYERLYAMRHLRDAQHSGATDEQLQHVRREVADVFKWTSGPERPTSAHLVSHAVDSSSQDGQSSGQGTIG